MIYQDENFCYYWHEGILMCDWTALHADYDFVELGIKKRIEITGSNPCVMISDIRSLKASTREARQRMAGKDASNGMVAVAVVVNSKVQSVIYNFFKEVYKLPAPARVFTNKAKAIEWCKQYVTPEMIENSKK